MCKPSEEIVMLYDLYRAQIDSLADSEETAQPRLRVLNQSEFEQWLLRDWRTPKLKRAWLARIIRGNEEIVGELSPSIQAVFTSFQFGITEERRVA